MRGRLRAASPHPARRRVTIRAAGRALTLSALALGACGERTPEAFRRQFPGCELPMPSREDRQITFVLPAPKHVGLPGGLLFDVDEPVGAPVKAEWDERYIAYRISDSGAELVRSNRRSCEDRICYHGMSNSDDYALSRVVFGGDAIAFDRKQGFGKRLNDTILPTDNLVFVDDGWVIGVIVKKEHVTLAPYYRRSARAALATLARARVGCGEDGSSRG